MEIQIVGGSVRGKDHVIAGKNNQDAFDIKKAGNNFAAVVCDGCGSGSHTEVGSNLAANFIANYLLENRDADGSYWRCLAHLEKHLEEYLVEISYSFGQRNNEIVNENLLFTIVGVVGSEHNATFFSLGDGYIAINGEVRRLGPFENNAPPYFAYNLMIPKPKFPYEITINEIVNINELQNFVIATDGLEELIEAEKVPHPTIKDREVGSISQFWEDDKYFSNSFTLGRQLNLLSGGVPRLIDVNGEKFFATRNGILRDDTTFVVGRIRNDDNG